MAQYTGTIVAALACLWALHGVLGAQELPQPYVSLTDYGLASLSAQTFSNDSSSGISASLGGLSPSDLLGQPRWDRIAAYTQRWADSLAAHPPASGSEQEQLLRGLLAVWLVAAASAGVTLPGAGGEPGVAATAQRGSGEQLKPLLPPFLDDFVLSPQLSVLKDGRWGLLDGHLAWQARQTLKSTLQPWNWGASVPPASLGKPLIPQTTGDVAAAVATAAAAGRRVRAIGKGHTWTPMFFDDDGKTDVVFTSLLRLPSGQRIEMAGRVPVHPRSASGAPLVRISAGVTTGELAQYTTDHAAELGNAALPADVVLTTTRLGGVVSTGSHGTAKEFGAIPDYVESLTIVDGRGQPTVYNASSPYFAQARTSFGLMGVITELTMRLASTERDPDKPFAEVSYSYGAMNDMFGTAGSPAKLKALVEAHYSVELFWYPLNNASATKDFSPAAWDPYADRLMVFMVDRAAAAPGGPAPEAFSNKPNAVASLETYLGAVATQVVAPRLIVTSQQYIINRPGLKTLPAAIHYGRNAVDQFKCYDFEMWFRVDPAFVVPFAAWNAVVAIAKDTLVTNGSNVLNLALEARFLAQSTTTMSPGYFQGDALFFAVEVLAAEGTPGWPEFQQRVFDAWTSLSGVPAPPKPHWAKWANVATTGHKRTTFDAGLSPIDRYAQRVFADQMALFRPAVAAADPAGVFRNAWLTDIFGLS